MPKPAILHKSKIVQRGTWTRTTTACNRMALQDDGMNVADTDAAVTCKLCLRVIAARAND